jgi:hypothetical protein
MTPRRTLLAAAAAALALLAPLAAEAAPLVVRSAGPSAKSYPPGRSLADNASLALQAGDVVIVLVANATRTLRGPGTFSLAGPVRTLAANSFSARGRFGAMRTGDLPASPSVWHVDVSQSGKVCVADPAKVELWRPESAEKVTLSIAPAGGAARSVEWSEGKASLAWPAGVALSEGAEYEVTWTGAPEPTRLSFAKVGALADDRAAIAKALIEKGCQTQLDYLIDTTPGE